MKLKFSKRVLKRMPKIPFALASTTMVLVACATNYIKPQNTCANLDWFEIGRNEAASGGSIEILNDYQVACNKTAFPVDESLFTVGYNAGLVDYCTSAMGLSLGRQGYPLPNICPEHLKSRLESGYRVGVQLRQLENENQDLQARIENLIRLMTSGSSGESLQHQLEQLRQRRAQIDSRISDLEAHN